MSDINQIDPAPAAPLPHLTDEALMEAIELLYFAYRDFVSDPDKILKELSFGRAHHRVIHFVGRHPGMTVAELLAILRITKQSLGRVLKQLVEQGYVEQETGTTDRRQRLLTLTEKGQALQDRLSSPQRERISRAFREAGGEAVEAYRQLLLGIVNEDERSTVLNKIKQG